MTDHSRVKDEIRAEEKEKESEFEAQIRNISDKNEEAVDEEFEKEFKDERSAKNHEIDRLRPKIAEEARERERFDNCFRNEAPPTNTHKKQKESQIEDQTREMSDKNEAAVDAEFEKNFRDRRNARIQKEHQAELNKEDQDRKRAKYEEKVQSEIAEEKKLEKAKDYAQIQEEQREEGEEKEEELEAQTNNIPADEAAIDAEFEKEFREEKAEEEREEDKLKPIIEEEAKKGPRFYC